MAYTYDPSQNIQQGLQQAAAGVGNIFTQVIAQQQRDYNLAENAFQNIEALKKNLNIFGQKSITSKANDLLGKTSFIPWNDEEAAKPRGTQRTEYFDQLVIV